MLSHWLISRECPRSLQKCELRASHGGVMGAGALELLQRGELPADFWDWECGAAFRFARDEGADEGAAGRASSGARWVQGSPSAGPCWQASLPDSLTAAVPDR